MPHNGFVGVIVREPSNKLHSFRFKSPDIDIVRHKKTITATTKELDFDPTFLILAVEME